MSRENDVFIEQTVCSMLRGRCHKGKLQNNEYNTEFEIHHSIMPVRKKYPYLLKRESAFSEALALCSTF